MSEEADLAAYAMGLLDAHVAALAEKVPAADGEDPADAVARSQARRLAIAAAQAAGVSALGLRDFVARVEADMPKAASRIDPTGSMGLPEFIETLRTDAPHLFGTLPKPGNGAATKDVWE